MGKTPICLTATIGALLEHISGKHGACEIRAKTDFKLTPPPSPPLATQKEYMEIYDGKGYLRLMANRANRRLFMATAQGAGGNERESTSNGCR